MKALTLWIWKMLIKCFKIILKILRFYYLCCKSDVYFVFYFRVLGLIQALTEITTRNLTGVLAGRSVMQTNSKLSLSLLSRIFRTLDASHRYETPRPVTGITLRVCIQTARGYYSTFLPYHVCSFIEENGLHELVIFNQNKVFTIKSEFVFWTPVKFWLF
jgi:hypothetical protein